MCRLYKEKNDQALTKQEEIMSINLCNHIAKSPKIKKLGEIYVVTTKNRLKPAKDVVNLNLDWKTSFNYQNYDIVHDQIPPKNADLLGCKSQRSAMFEDIPNDFEEFGQKVDLKNEIKQIITDYGQTFIEEIVKNFFQT